MTWLLSYFPNITFSYRKGGRKPKNDEQIYRKKQSHHNNLPPCWKSGKIMHCGRSTHTTWYQIVKSQFSMAKRLRRNHDFLKLLAKCTPAQRKAILKEADDALVKTICKCVLNVLKETVPVSKPAKRKLLAHKK